MDRSKQIEVVKSWLKDLSAVIGANLTLNEDGLCSFQVGGDIIVIEVSQDFPMVHIYSSLLAMPTNDKELSIALMIRALELNAFQILTRGGSIALAPGGVFLMYSVSTPTADVNSEKFSAILGAFFESLAEVKKMLLEESGAAAPMNKGAQRLS